MAGKHTEYIVPLPQVHKQTNSILYRLLEKIMSYQQSYLRRCLRGWKRAYSSLAIQGCLRDYALCLMASRSIEMERYPPIRSSMSFN